MNSGDSRNKNTVERMFGKYVFQNILGMLGISVYILADTFFISMAEGAGGITALNLVLPIYSLIYGIGAMIGVGSAIKFNILRARKDESADAFFSNAVIFAFIFSLIFIFAGIFAPSALVRLLGGDEVIVAIGTPYTRIFLICAPFFMGNIICNAFVRNDGNPTFAMQATLFSSFFNIVMDYVFMFPMGLGMAGAALATGLSPVVGMLMCCRHFFSKRSSIKFLWQIPSFKRLLEVCRLGVAAFVGEISSGVTTAIFNFLILSLAGNAGVAAYGVVANIAIVATAIFNGVAQGTQPLFSQFHGKKERETICKILKLGFGTAIVLALIIVIVTLGFTEGIVAIFNSENNHQMEMYAMKGVKIYFWGFLFAGLNIVGSGYLSAIEEEVLAFGISMIRGVVAISICAFVLAHFLGMTGIWLAFPTAEFITLLVLVIGMKKNERIS